VVCFPREPSGCVFCYARCSRIGAACCPGGVADGGGGVGLTVCCYACGCRSASVGMGCGVGGWLFGGGGNCFGEGAGGVPEPDRPLPAVAAGAMHSLVLTESGEVYAWGDNAFGQLGLGDTEDRLTPTKVTDLRR